MSRKPLEFTLDAHPGASSPHRDLPTELARYVQAFPRVSRDSLRFLWRDGSVWLAVQLVRRAADGGERVIVRAAEVDLPRGVTVREVDVLTLLALGLTNQGIAERLGTSSRTVSTQIERLLDKLDQETRGGLAALAVDTGLLCLPVPGGAGPIPTIGIVELEMAASGRRPAPAEPLFPRYPGKMPLKVGVLLPVAAAAADGEEVLQGATLAVEELNSSGGISGRRLELVTAEVDVFSRDSVQRGLVRLFGEEVDAITTSYGNGQDAEDIDLVAEYGRPFLHTATFDEQVRLAEADPRRYGAVLQTCASETSYGLGLIRLLGDLQTRSLFVPRNRRLVSVEADTMSTRVTNDVFVAAAERAGWSLHEVIRVPVGSTDWPAVVRRLLAADPEVVMLTHFLAPEVTAFQREFLASGLESLVYGVYGPSIPDFQDSIGPGADGVIWSTTTGTYDDVLGRRFRGQFAARFGRPAGWSQAGAAYDQVRLLASAWAATGVRDARDVVGYLRRWPHRGVNGVYYFGEASQSTLSYPDATPDASMGQAHMIYQIQAGQHRPIAPEPFGSAATFRLPPWRTR
ncbi:ABC transporter substrate-binding protein [Kineosporia succinea]|uniref:Branched-chain amino acid transport system substrate-binding protein n=1 Tax=Kineosporia succinea TaxID=84632 RepID=A0ABT9PCL4_9ACTN|nr:ABC transporter substrate-binding protein [Kineosporia succinea]MDP9830236.1 branched-chain amino acid transport system substrate-binding protein [Kineosporia succinea]